MTELEQLNEAVQAAGRALQDSPTRHLGFAVRHSLWKALGPHRSDTRSSDARSLGQIRRVELAKLCVLHVYKSSPDCDVATAHALFRTIDGFNAGTVSSDSLQHEIGILTCESDNLSLKHREQESLLIAALAKVACVALYDELMGDVEIEPAREEPLDPYDWDAALLTLGAYSKGFPWHHDSELSKRLEYWTWYLHEGVPQAAASAR